MPRQRVSQKVLGFFQDMDVLARLWTGKNLKGLAARTVELLTPEKGEDPDNPYNILGIREGAMDFTVKAAFRAAAREYHPDTGTHSDPKAFQRVQEAYNNIKAARAGGNEPKG